jgi:hypothetical protein
MLVLSTSVVRPQEWHALTDGKATGNQVRTSANAEFFTVPLILTRTEAPVKAKIVARCQQAVIDRSPRFGILNTNPAVACP